MTKKILFISITLIGACGFPEDSESLDAKAVDEQQEQYRISQPIPRFDFSLERDIAIQLYQARNERVTTHTVWRSDMGIIEGDCPSVGYPLPYDTSLTNPVQLTHGVVHGRADWMYLDGVVEQAEPNGLFSSKNSIATWVRCLTEVNGKDVEAPIYIESKVTAYPYPVQVDYEKNRVMPVAGARPSIQIKKK